MEIELAERDVRDRVPSRNRSLDFFKMIILTGLNDKIHMQYRIQKRYNQWARVYDILLYPLEKKIAQWRRALLKDVRGHILEIGIGTGNNIPYYTGEVELTGIDFSEGMLEVAAKKAKDKPNVQLKVMNAENLEFEDNSFDGVVTSCVYCSVPHPVKGLREIKRVCKEGGKIYMLEHVRSNHKVAGKIMDRVNTITSTLSGEHINRQTYVNLLKAGFNPDQITTQHLWFDIVKLFIITNQ